ncbi:hypothetical protein [Paenibacillus rigui]|uniref:Uncharacterized protein n=1 Tax=Paenibacillus rigui TaxID=554312 RepID=A0A229UVW8_9BACL|nr:hypothetical protein [Paenibacillus rigui]OXM87737.1 hypothetical protein CF651_01040 [Paenibacillus rigui]
MHKSGFIVCVVMALLLTSCQAKASPSPTATIEKQLQLLVNNQMTSVSSNPGDSIRANADAYQSIVNQGQDGFEYLTAELKKSEHNGLKEWIMAKACADILGERNPIKQWSTGKEWLTAYEKSQ